MSFMRFMSLWIKVHSEICIWNKITGIQWLLETTHIQDEYKASLKQQNYFYEVSKNEELDTII